MRHQIVMLPVFLLFQWAQLWPLEKPKNPPAALLLYTITSSAVQVEFYNYNDSVARVARRSRVPTVCSRDIASSQRGIILIEYTQIR
jgi:hypothetical protein